MSFVSPRSVLNVPQSKAEGNVEVESVLIEVDIEVESALIFHDFP